MKQYEVILIDRKLNRRASFVADTFRLTEDRVIYIRSESCGNVAVKMEPDEQLNIIEIYSEDEEEKEE